LFDGDRKALVPIIEATTGLKYRKTIQVGGGPDPVSDAYMIEGIIERNGVKLEVEGALRAASGYEGWARHYKSVLSPDELRIARARKAETSSGPEGRKSKEYKAYKHSLLVEVQKRVAQRESNGLRSDYDPDQPRAENGQFGEGTGTGRAAGEHNTSISSVGESSNNFGGGRSEAKARAQAYRNANDKVASRTVAAGKGNHVPERARDDRDRVAASKSDMETLVDGKTPSTERLFSETLPSQKGSPPNPDYDPARAAERVPLHVAYTEETTSGVPTSNAPVLYMTGGGPASGKTSGLLKNPELRIPNRENAAHINPDSAKEALPEYRAGIQAGDEQAANNTHEESSYMAKESTTHAIKAGHDVVLDTVGDSGISKLQAKVEQLRRDGATKIVASYATNDVDTALERATSRGIREGRVVNAKYLRESHADVARTVPAAIERGVFDELTVWDTEDRAPRLLATYTRGSGLKINDQIGWDRFLSRGK
jgi:predicted ABC-type ATPase